MPWLSVSFGVAAPDLEAVTDALLAAGALSVDVEDADAGSAVEAPNYAEGITDPQPWARNVVRALLEEGVDPVALVADACARAGIAVPTCSVAAVPERDWVRATQAQFLPIRISPRLWIVPSWLEPPDPAALNITLDPGVAFGTGNHPTTRLCLRWLEANVAGGETLIDYGCGSGILAIAALRLGAGRAIGIDIDPQALLAARDNALQNRVEAEFWPAAVPVAVVADIVIANILARPLIALAPALARLTRRGGRLALAGVLAQQAAEVGAAYAEWFDLRASEPDEEWVLLAGRRK